MHETRAGQPDIPSEDVIAARLCDTFRAALGQPDLTIDEGFLAAGGDSLTAVETILEIEDVYAVSLSTAEFMALDSARNLARHIVGNMEKAARSRPAPKTKGATQLSEVQSGERGSVLICSYGLTGSAPYAITLAGVLPADQTVAASQTRADVISQQKLTTFADTAKCDADNIVRQYPNMAYALLGFSLGSHVALSVGHELVRQNARPSFIAVLDDEADLDQRHFGALTHDPQDMALPLQIKSALRRSTPEPISARIVYFRSAENEAYYKSDPTSGWGEIATGGVVHMDIPADHLGLADAGGLRLMAPRLVDELSKPCHAPPPPSDAQMLRFKARRAAREGCLATELKLLDQIIRQDREQPSWVYANRAEAFFQKGDPLSARAALADARAQDCWQLTLDMRFAKTLVSKKCDPEIHEIVTRLARTKADHPSVHDQKARAYFDLGMTEDCARELASGLAMQSDHFRLSQFHLRFLGQHQKWVDLRDAAERLIDQFPGVNQFRTALIRGYLRTGAPEKALRFRDEFAAEGRFDYRGLNAFGRALLRSGRAPEALQISEQAIRVAPSRPAAYALRAKCRRALSGRV